MRPIYVCLATDENYVQLATVSITSIFEKNKEASQIEIYILDGGIKECSKDIIYTLGQKYKRKVIFIDVKYRLKELEDMNVNSQGNFGSYAAYSRFFIVDELPEYVDKILYIDCDTCVTESLNDLFNIDMKGYALGAILDILPTSHKKYIGFSNKDNYYNSGVLIFNCKVWNRERYTEKLMNHIKNVRSEYSFHDQDLINIVCKEKIMTLKPQYMVFYPEYTWGEKKLRWLNDYDGLYYSNKELEIAIEKPIIIHYVDSILGRPWYKNNINKYASYWNENKRISPYSENFNMIEKKSSFRNRVFRMLYRYLPLFIFIRIHKYRRDQLLSQKESRINVKWK